MDFVTLSFAASLLLLLMRPTAFYLETSLRSVTVLFIRAGSAKSLRMLGGFWFVVVGAPLAAYWIVQFFFSNVYPLNLNTIIATLSTFTGPALPIVLLFLGLWAVFSFSWIGGNALYQRNKSKK